MNIHNLFSRFYSRRSAIKSIGMATTAAAAGTIIRPQDVHAVNSISKTDADALAIIGDESHNSDYIRSGLGSNLVDDYGLAIDFSDEEKLISYENLKHYKILIIFRDGLRFPYGYWYSIYWNPKDIEKEVISDPPIEKPIGEGRVGWMTEQQGRDIKRWVSEGGSLWAWHNNSHASLMNEDYHDVEGAVYAGHPPIRPFKVVMTDKSHPITKGVNDFVVTDEQHYVRYDKDPKHVIARSVYEGPDNPGGWKDNFGRVNNSAEAVWAYEYGKGRVCFTAPGHMVSALFNPEYIKLQHNAVRWLLRG
jgi:hypothetical protein